MTRDEKLLLVAWHKHICFLHRGNEPEWFFQLDNEAMLAMARCWRDLEQGKFTRPLSQEQIDLQRDRDDYAAEQELGGQRMTNDIDQYGLTGTK